MAADRAVWLRAKLGTLDIGPAPPRLLRDNEILVRNGAVAINPVDWMTLVVGDVIFPWLTYPFVLGSDVAGEVVALGAGVTRFKVGDRVLGHAVGAEKSRNDPAEGAFQTCTVLLDHMACPIPASMAYETAAVLPLGLSTAACGLFQKEFLALDYPVADPQPNGKTLLVWGGERREQRDPARRGGGLRGGRDRLPEELRLCEGARRHHSLRLPERDGGGRHPARARDAHPRRRARDRRWISQRLRRRRQRVRGQQIRRHGDARRVL